MGNNAAALSMDIQLLFGENISAVCHDNVPVRAERRNEVIGNALTICLLVIVSSLPVARERKHARLYSVTKCDGRKKYKLNIKLLLQPFMTTHCPGLPG